MIKPDIDPLTSTYRSGNIVRGGSYFSFQRRSRATSKSYLHTNVSGYVNVGFRLVLRKNRSDKIRY